MSSTPPNSAVLPYRPTTPRSPTLAGGCAFRTWRTAWWTPVRTSVSSAGSWTRPCWRGSLPRGKRTSWPCPPGPDAVLAVHLHSALQRGRGEVALVSHGPLSPQSEGEKHLPPVHAVHGPRDGNPLLSGEGEAEWGRLQLLLRGPALHGAG